MKLALISSVLIFLSACVPPAKILPSQVDFPSITGIIYDSAGARVTGTQSFSSVSGSFVVVFNGSGQTGNFQFIYNNFYSPDLCPYLQECSCTGRFFGTYSRSSAPAQSTNTGNTYLSPNYNPLPTPTPSSTSTSTNSAPSNVTTTYLSLMPSEGNNLPYPCPAASNRDVQIQIINDSTLIITDLDKDFFFKPRKSN